MNIFLKIPKIQKAFEFCVISHKGQMYGTDLYFIHPLRVAERVKNPTEDEIVIALLHDVIEDCDVTHSDIENMFGTFIADCVELLTKDCNMTYDENITRLLDSGIDSVVKVKWADNKVNMSGDKSNMTEKRRNKLNERYAKSFLRLSNHLENN